ncbi:HAD-IC family P-type ATPase [Desulfofundulus thermobenzoicus]|uniref:HAD-IC family P-type ATPase n=2 Tax=Desulfofundulus thermobenzoicus TaxID=29376 RepID=A0A6N7ISV2_9FIRM|nr:HAD-IC family P-type ATPase [Desulfofundulus thermobenzoicus]
MSGMKDLHIVHFLPGRVRVAVPGLKRNPLLLDVLCRHLSRLPGVTAARGSTTTGRLLVHFQGGLAAGNVLGEIALCASHLRRVEISLPEIAATGATRPYRVEEPEDLPLKRQMANVILGGTALALVGAKRAWRGPSRLARSPGLFYLSAAATILSGYPLLKSGVQHLSARGRLNYDLLLGLLSMGTLLLRESVPGLLVVWLVNLNALIQSLILKRFQQVPGQEAGTDKPVRPWSPSCTGDSSSARRYGDRMLPVAFGLSALTGLVTGSFNRSLAMLLAASPGPAGLAAPTALSSGLALAARRGMGVSHPECLRLLSRVDVLVLHGDWGLTRGLQVTSLYPLAGHSRREILSRIATLFAAAGQPLAGLPVVVAGNLKVGKQPVEIISVDPGGVVGRVMEEEVAVGSRDYLAGRGYDLAAGLLKARRAGAVGEVPLFACVNGQPVAVLGTTLVVDEQARQLTGNLRARGIKRLVLTGGGEEDRYRPLAGELGLEIWPDLSTARGKELLLAAREKGEVVALAVASRKTGSPPPVDVLIAGGGTGVPGAQIILPAADMALLPPLFSLGLAVSLRERQNLQLVAGLNALGLALSSTGRLAPVAAAAYNNLISILVVLNACRLMAPGNPGKKGSAGGPGKGPGKWGRQTGKDRQNHREGENGGGEGITPVRKESSVLGNGWPHLELADVFARLQCSPEGLSSREARVRLERYGPNQLATVPPPGLLRRFLNQMKDFLVQALLGSSVLCLFMGEIADSLAILTILTVNALLGALQEQKAEGALQALKEMVVPTARVLRDGQWQRIPAHLLVPGDVILLEAGDGVPADARLIRVDSLEVVEAALTGESYPVAKDLSAPGDCVTLLDCHNMVFMGTVISRGRGVALVVSTGKGSELGKIAGLLAEGDNQVTPMQKSLATVGKKMLEVSLVVSGLVLLAGLFRGGSPMQMFLTGVSLAVAAIPEGLPAMVTAAMASGVHRLARANAVVRRLPAVENLGSATVICTDKTGTLTRNEQTVGMVYEAGGVWWQSTAGGYDPHRGTLVPLNESSPEGLDRLLKLLAAASLCSNARLVEKGGRWRVEGDPMEGAILAAAARVGLELEHLSRGYERVREIPFDSRRLRMTVICRYGNEDCYSFVKGAPDVILQLCGHYQGDGGVMPLDELSRRRFMRAVEKMAAGALRVLGVACRPLNGQAPGDNPEAEKELVFLGLLGLHDPPRPEVRAAIHRCRQAGIRVVMITGDHRETALAVGRELGLAGPAARVLTGAEIDAINDRQLAEALPEVSIFARMLPEHKLRLVRALKNRGELVAMIGDGVNDAPALKEASIGVAMGMSGTDVTRQAADLILTDDNFGTIVAAVEQGRGICLNVRRAVRYLLATNVGEVLLMFLAVLGGLPLPLLPIQLLWLNLLGDGLPALALGIDPPGPRVMQVKEYGFSRGMFDREFTSRVLSRGLAIGASSLGAYWWSVRHGGLAAARSVALSSLTLSQLVYALDCRRQGEDRVDTRNPFLNLSVMLSGTMLLAALYLPRARRIFHTVPLTFRQWDVVFLSTALTGILDYITRPLIAAFLPAGEKGCVQLEKSPDFPDHQVIKSQEQY